MVKDSCSWEEGRELLALESVRVKVGNKHPSKIDKQKCHCGQLFDGFIWMYSLGTYLDQTHKENKTKRKSKMDRWDNKQNEKQNNAIKGIFPQVLLFQDDFTIHWLEDLVNPPVCIFRPSTACVGLTFEIIIYNPKQLSGLRLSWDQEFQKPLRNERICV